MTITHPLRLAVGSHQAGSGKGCAMNQISWENGDTIITDLPSCADPLLARVVQAVNDRYCTHRTGDLLCPPCSVAVLALAHRTVGTALAWTDDDRRVRLYVRLALDEAESVARADEDSGVTACRRIIAAWLDGKASTSDVRSGRRLAAAAAHADAAGYAACAAYYAACAADFAAAAHAVDYGVYAAAGYDEPATRMQRAHALIDRFEALTRVVAPPPNEQRTEAACAAMTVPLPRYVVRRDNGERIYRPHACDNDCPCRTAHSAAAAGDQRPAPAAASTT
jgi:hypothetical protein